MATVNLLNSSWLTDKTNSDITITTSSTDGIKFRIGTSASSKTGWAKGCISFNASKYSKIVIKYSKISTAGNTDLYCGVYNSISASSNDPATSSLVVSSFNKTNGSTITFNIPSSVSGTKYVGFYFYGNSHNTSSGSSEHIYVTSITATERGYTLTYNANGGSGAPSAVKNITSTIISSTKPTRTGYDFLGWSKSSSATSASYVSGNSISLSSNVTLYAVWKIKTYAVTYNANGGSGAPSTQYKTHGTTLTLSSTKPTKSPTSPGNYTVTLNANGGTCSYTSLSAKRTTSYAFSKWNTNSSGTGTSYNAGASYTTNSALSLYAIYTSSTSTAAVTLPTPTRDGYKFMGWSKSKTATSGTTGSYTTTGNVTLYAIWKPMGLVRIYDGGDFSSYKVLIYDGSGWNQYIPYIYTGSGWEIYSG